MVEISNIDAIIELILREARAREEPNHRNRAFIVLRDVSNKLEHVFDNLEEEEKRKKKDDKKAEWDKGM